MALGNLIGSNLFNIAAVLGLAAIIAPIAITSRVVLIDIPFMLLMSMLLLAMLRSKKLLKRYGIVLLLLYILFIYLQLFRI